jgi:hypothetical protein
MLQLALAVADVGEELAQEGLKAFLNSSQRQELDCGLGGFAEVAEGHSMTSALRPIDRCYKIEGATIDRPLRERLSGAQMVGEKEL